MNPHRLKLLALFAVVMTIWLNLAYVHHSLDVITEHHAHHDCHLFSSVHHGATSAPLIWFDDSLPDVIEKPVTQLIPCSESHTYRARSPPLFV